MAGRRAGHGRGGSGRSIARLFCEQLEILEVVRSRFNGVDREHHARRAVASLATVTPDRRRLEKTS